MKKSVALAVIVLCATATANCAIQTDRVVSSGLQAQGENWDTVKALLRGSELAILIEQHDQRQLLRGRLDSIDDTQLVISARRPFSMARGRNADHSVTVARSAIRKIDWVIIRRHWWQGFDDRAVVYYDPRP
jgi:hypothetical protein